MVFINPFLFLSLCSREYIPKLLDFCDLFHDAEKISKIFFKFKYLEGLLDLDTCLLVLFYYLQNL